MNVLAQKCRRESGSVVFDMGPVLVIGALLFLSQAVMVAVQSVRNAQASGLHASSQVDIQISRAEFSLTGFSAAGVAGITDLEVAGSSTLHGGWDDPAESKWSEWQGPDDGVCDLAVTADCWQVKFGPTLQSARRQSVISHDERDVYVRGIAGCPRAGPGFPHKQVTVGGQTVDVPLPDADLDVMRGLCEEVQETQARYRARSFLQYGLHLGSQQLSPVQAAGQGNAPIDRELDLTSGTPLDTTDDVPFHTNLDQVYLCTHGTTAGWPRLGGKVEVSNSTSGVAIGDVVMQTDTSGTVVSGSAADAFVSVGTPCTAGLGAPPAAITVRNGRPLLVSLETDESPADSTRRCSQSDPAPPQWMLPARATAGRATPSGIHPTGSRVDLALLSDGDVIFGDGNLTVHGSPPAASSITVIAAGSLAIEGTAVGPTGGSGVLAMIAGCDILIADPILPSDPLSTGLDAAAHSVRLERVALMAPHGAFYPVAFQRPAATTSQFPRVQVNGAVATLYVGGFSVHGPGAQIGGYNLELSYPASLVDEIPPWWPDPLGGAWQRIG